MAAAHVFGRAETRHATTNTVAVMRLLANMARDIAGIHYNMLRICGIATYFRYYITVNKNHYTETIQACILPAALIVV
jgi:hypothetical protein